MLHLYNLIGDVDYTSGPYDVPFPANVTVMSLNVSIIDDSILEGNEQFNLIIARSVVTAHNPHRVTVIIQDDDSK